VTTQSLDNIDSSTGLLKGTFAIGTFAQGDRKFPAVVLPDGSAADASELYADTHAIFDDWETAFGRLGDLAARSSSATLRVETLTALPPIARPNMLCAGANYRQHVAEMMTHNKFNAHNRKEGESDEAFFQRNLEAVDRRAREGMPFFWTGLHSSLGGANDDVLLPAVGKCPDWELELGAVLGGTGRYLRPEEAGKLVAGYIMVNDIGTVDEFRRTDVNWGYDWISKHQPGFKPAGPFIVPSQFVTLTDDVRIKLKVNGQVMQDWPVTDMIFGLDKLLSYASERIRLMPGDIMITGSPPGNGAMHGRFLQDGDVMESEITYLGRQTNHCRTEPMNGRTVTWGSFNDLIA
jgi:2,4-didehydro-3-deoxy-L-rhamnonate hydrolase